MNSSQPQIYLEEVSSNAVNAAGMRAGAQMRIQVKRKDITWQVCIIILLFYHFKNSEIRI